MRCGCAVQHWYYLLKAKLIPLHQTYWAHSLKEVNLQMHKPAVDDDNRNTFLCLYVSSQWMMTILVQQWLLFVWELSPWGILQADTTQVMYAAAVDWIICTVSRRGACFFFSFFLVLCLCSMLCYTLRDTERTHMFTRAIERMATRAAPKGAWHPGLHPLSLWGRCPDYWVTLCRSWGPSPAVGIVCVMTIRGCE